MKCGNKECEKDATRILESVAGLIDYPVPTFSEDAILDFGEHHDNTERNWIGYICESEDCYDIVQDTEGGNRDE